MATPFVQYKYCSICRSSCKKMRKHVHSPRHQEIVKNILLKFAKKVSDAKSHLEKPLVKDTNWEESERQIWCYFCACDVSYHLRKTTMAGECVLASAGFLGHMTRKDHSENTAKFLKGNLVDMKRTPEFLLDNDIFLKFLEKAENTAIDFLTSKREILKRAASSIRLQSQFRHQTMHQGLLDQIQKEKIRHGDFKSTQDEPRSDRLLASDEPGCERKKTVQAFGEGLTTIDRLNEDDSQGNIHSNALPPWLRRDEDDDAHRVKVIGPSIIDWTKHKKLEEKKKLPACRVGAKFDHATSQGDEWLPNFGGVWSHGPRTKSGKHFRKRSHATYQSHGKESKLVDGEDSRHHLNPIPESLHDPLALGSLARLQYSSHTSTETKSVNRSDFHNLTGSEHYLPVHHEAQNHTFSTSVLPSCSTSYTQYDDNKSSSLSFTKTLKPYVSKRRKAAPCNSDSFSYYNYPGTSYSSGFSTPASNSLHPPFFRPSVSDTNTTPVNQSCVSQTTSPPLRLLPTPVLRNKK